MPRRTTEVRAHERRGTKRVKSHKRRFFPRKSKKASPKRIAFPRGKAPKTKGMFFAER